MSYAFLQGFIGTVTGGLLIFTMESEDGKRHGMGYNLGMVKTF